MSICRPDTYTKIDGGGENALDARVIVAEIPFYAEK